MKKFIIVVVIIAAVCGVIGVLLLNKNDESKNSNSEYSEEEIDKNTIEYTGWLKTNGAELQNQKGEKIQLRGLSSHGIQWFPEVITYENLKELKENWNINVFRIAMYTDPNVNGYIAHPDESKALVKKIVDYAKELDLYVIIDWHILSDKNPQMYQDDSIKFFDEMSKEYADTPNVLYEICNEPNGIDISWDANVKPYAEELIKTIRKNCPKSLIIIGTPDWCKDIKSAADNPIMAPNIVYSCHFYAGSHRKELRDDIEYCISKNIPIFVSECGITNASGQGALYEEYFREWVEFMNEKNISWVFWSFCNKDESSSVLKPEYKPYAEETINSNNEEQENELDESAERVNVPVDINEYLTKTGEIIKSLLSK